MPSTIHEMAIAKALPERLSEEFSRACAHCLGFAAKHLNTAFNHRSLSVAAASMGIFESFVADAKERYGITRAEALDALNALQGKLLFSEEVSEASVDFLKREVNYDEANEPL